MQELWQPIAGCETRYLVSSAGRVKSLPLIVPNAQGNGTHTRPGKILKPYIRENGYSYVVLRDKNQAKTQTVHMLVALAFLPSCPGEIGRQRGRWQVDHIDEDKQNNSAQNLRWLLGEENRRRSCTKLTPEIIREIRARRAAGERLKDLGNAFGKSEAAVSMICSGTTWAWVEN